MSILIQQDDGQLIPYTEVNRGWSLPEFVRERPYSWVIDRNGRVLGKRDSEGKPVPMSDSVADQVQKIVSRNLYGLKRGNPDALNSLDQLRTIRSVDRNPHNPYAVGSHYTPDDDGPTTFLENGSGTPAPDQPPQYGGPLVRRQKLQDAIDNSNDNNPYLGGNYGSKRPGWGLVEENPQPTDVTDAVMKALKADGNTSFANWRQSLANQGWNGDPSKIKYDPSTGKFMSNGGGQAFKGTGKPKRVRQGRSSGNLSKSDGNTYATAGIPKGGVVSPATMMRTSGVPPVQVGYGMNVPIGETGEPDYTLTYDPKTSSMKPNNPYYYYDPSRNPPNEYTYDPITHELVRR